jgi:GAF domain-containing protein/HAMP domain-containing protein
MIVLVMAALAGLVAAQRVAAPIVSLTNTASQIAAGDLNSHAIVETQDEIGTLANTFNLMTMQLNQTLGDLEQRVAERTVDVEMARIVSERRAQELQSISEISRVISVEQRLETLLSLITRLVSEKFGFYHAGIFLIDDTRQYAVLQAANSEGGQKMLAHGHRLEVGQAGLVGNVAQTGHPRIALDVGTDAFYFDNVDLPETRSEIALPLTVRGITIGVLDVQSTKPGAFTDNERTLGILADQIAIAIENARLFGQNKQALAEVQSLYDQYLRQEWSLFGKQEKQVGYFQSVVGGRPLQKAIDSDEIRTALHQGTVVIVDGKTEKSVPTIVVPVRLRGQTLGILNIKAPTPNRRWNQDEINLAQAVSDRLALALDNARLLFESQRQTAKEQKIGEVTAKIGASINMQNVLQTAVEELGRALPGSEVIIQFQSNGKQE